MTTRNDSISLANAKLNIRMYHHDHLFLSYDQLVSSMLVVGIVSSNETKGLLSALGSESYESRLVGREIVKDRVTKYLESNP